METCASLMKSVKLMIIYAFKQVCQSANVDD